MSTVNKSFVHTAASMSEKGLAEMSRFSRYVGRPPSIPIRKNMCIAVLCESLPPTTNISNPALSHATKTCHLAQLIVEPSQTLLSSIVIMSATIKAGKTDFSGSCPQEALSVVVNTRSTKNNRPHLTHDGHQKS